MDILNAVNDLNKTQVYTPNVEHNIHTHSSQEVPEDKEKLKKILQESVEDLNQALVPLNTKVEFRFDPEVDGLQVKIIDTHTNEVIREFPPKDVIKLRDKVKEVVGLLFDQKG